MNKTDSRSGQKDKSSHVSDETILKIAKEISVKFIEVGKINPSTFEIAFKKIYSTIDKTVRNK